MTFYNYIYMVLYIGAWLYFQWTEAPMPETLPQTNLAVSAGFILWAAYSAGYIIVDCLRLRRRNEMSAEHMRQGILLALAHNLPVFLMSGFMLREGFTDAGS